MRIGKFLEKINNSKQSTHTAAKSNWNVVFWNTTNAWKGMKLRRCTHSVWDMNVKVRFFFPLCYVWNSTRIFFLFLFSLFHSSAKKSVCESSILKTKRKNHIELVMCFNSQAHNHVLQTFMRFIFNVLFSCYGIT